eukprot:377072_1
MHAVSSVPDIRAKSMHPVSSAPDLRMSSANHGIPPLDADFGASSVREIGITRHPIRLEFKDIKFSVHVRKGKTRAVLRNVSGMAEPGKFMAILGPSGAGKRSLK